MWPGDDATFYLKSVYFVKRVLQSSKFDGVVSVVIVLNSIQIGVEAQLIVTGGAI